LRRQRGIGMNLTLVEAVERRFPRRVVLMLMCLNARSYTCCADLSSSIPFNIVG